MVTSIYSISVSQDIKYEILIFSLVYKLMDSQHEYNNQYSLVIIYYYKKVFI